MTEQFTFENLYPNMHRAAAHIDRLWTLSHAWASYGRGEADVTDEQLSFIQAFVSNGMVSRTLPIRSPFSSGIHTEFLVQSNSIRKATKVRDLILCTMAQYDWYTPPPPSDVRRMDAEPGGSFPHLFKNCFLQAREANRAVIIQVTSGMVGDDPNTLATSNLPVPECLGDLVKLFDMATEGAPRYGADGASGLDLGPVDIRTVQPDHMATVLAIVERAIHFSRPAWEFALKGELSLLAAWADDEKFTPDVSKDSCFQNALHFLHLMAIGLVRGGPAKMDHDSFKRDLIRASPKNYAEPLLRLAALISCGIGISAYQWSRDVWEPIIATIGKHELLGLLSATEILDLGFVKIEKSSSSLQGPVEGNSIFQLGHPLPSNFVVDYEHVVITHPGEGLKSWCRCVGLLPAFQSRYEDDRTRAGRLKELGIGIGYAAVMVKLI